MYDWEKKTHAKNNFNTSKRPQPQILASTLATSLTPYCSHISSNRFRRAIFQPRQGPRRPASLYAANASLSQQSAVALVHAGLRSHPRRSSQEIEANPQFSRRSAVALVHAGPLSPLRRFLLEVVAQPQFFRRSTVTLFPDSLPKPT